MSDCERYCILTGYEELPRAFGSDIDFMVGPGDFERMPQLIETLCRDTGTSLFQAVQHEVASARLLCGGRPRSITELYSP